MSAPQVPPRPVRAHHQQQAPAGLGEMPRIPPRPTHRMAGRSHSPSGDHFPTSPLNEMPLAMNLGSKSGSVYSNDSRNTSESNLGLPQRPPSVSLPSLGQEGSEYADIEYEKTQDGAIDSGVNQNEPTQTRNVGSDLPLHAPRPSFSISTAKARVSTVTRTDSVQAAAAGIGKIGTPGPSDDKILQGTALRSKMGSSRTHSSASTERPASAQASDSDHGIPEIGQRVPMYPDAGDVQAPSPSPFTQTVPSGIGFHNDGTQKPGRHHGRTRSGREVFRGPPGSYGLHGHGVSHNDQFEKAWYDKHPDALFREEQGQYGPGIGGSRGEWALSSEDLNKIVRDTASRGSGLGASPNLVSLPNEQVGYMASEEYTSRIHTPTSGIYHSKSHSNHSQTHVESPLRKASFPVDVESKDAFETSKDNTTTRSQSEYALESETEDDEIHVKAPTNRSSKYTGNGYDPPTEDLGPHGGNTDAEGGWIEETGYGVPILASDEVAKEPGSEFLQPAVSPMQEKRGSNYYSGLDSDAPPSYQSGHRSSSRSGSASNSRPSSRPVSIHGSLPGLARFIAHDDREDMHTPLEDVDEYEPLFPEEEDKEGRPIPANDRFKRREIMKKRFPSQDIWEDTPNSLQLQATVETPEPAEEQIAPAPKTTSTAFELPEAEAERKGEVDEHEKAKLIPKDQRLAKSHFKPHLRNESERPSLKQRFPSRDIWEDSPDSACLETTVGESPEDENKGPSDEGLRAGAVVYTFGRPGESKTLGEKSRDGATAVAAAVEKPTIPPRPAKSKASGESTGPSSHPFPSIPVLPPRRLHQVPPAEIQPPLADPTADVSPVESKQISPSESRKAPTLPDRPKPQVPARPPRSTASHENSEMAPITKTTSASSVASGDAGIVLRGVTSPPPAPKPKPVLPSRPVGSKIASLKPGFLSDLDKRLQVGPQAPKPPETTSAENEPTGEKAPLADARKGRARGPARRKPAAPSAPIAEGLEPEETKANRKWTIQEAWTVWEINDDGTLNVGQAVNNAPPEPDTKYDPSNTTPASSPLSMDTVQGQEVTTLDATASKPESASAANLPAGGGPAATDQSKEISSKESSIKEFTPSSSPSPTMQAMSDEATQTGEKAITVNPGTAEEEKMTVYLGGEAQGHQNPVLRE